ncbi:hypothetical protein KAFR_0J00800 [Kazachstania africana CBS 2517]|uniref:Uncharacterized protein n=1 Tax=Kazachstania africana (strain ATCC 22294 / BCRC 22015 / CBS 2517 / CECT 1963 / NBRC 1671 / NRRL Y-8276) TaxID=1071382 RepID=H2B0J8_KAZAF|nr:hypothetical protein KAFR_0J00800 [Kazachstania africana CBS 2517]CCF60148.1 hypothetical protein KAFR_0J00800 [Kazachstania africana CBS 2517]
MSDRILSKFSSWKKYKNRGNRGGPVRRASIRRVDYTSVQELRSHKFIFHRGFTSRRDSLKRARKFSNKNELQSIMRYINLSQMNIKEIVTAPLMTIFQPLHNNSVVVPRRTVRTSVYKRRSIRRAATLPASLRSNHSRYSSNKRIKLLRLWKEYLLLVILQRVHLRINLLT